MNTLYTTIRDTLIAKVPELKYFDWDYGQFDGDSGTPPTVPAVLMDIETIDYSHGGRGMDYGDIIIIISCGFRIRGRSDSNAPTAQASNALAFLTILKAIGKALDGTSSDETGPLQRESLQRLQVPGINVYQYRFSTTYFEKDNLQEYGTVPKPHLEAS